MTDALVSFDRSRREAPVPNHTISRHTGLSFDRILVPLDGSPVSERCLPYVRAITRGLPAAQITLLHVLEEPHGIGGARRVDAVEWEMLRAERQAYLSGIAARLGSGGVDCKVELAQGTPADQIARFAKRNATDLIVFTSHGDGGIDVEWPLGGTAQKVVSTATTSLFIVPAATTRVEPNDEVHLQRMLLPLDCSRRAECILPAASELARSHDAELVLAHVVAEPELPRRIGPSREDVELARKLVEHNRREAAGYLTEIQNRLAGETGRVRVRLRVSADRTRMLRELAEHESIDLVILSAHGSTGSVQQRYGGVAGQFLQCGFGPVIILQDLAGAAAHQQPAETAPEHRGR